ncbi:hypothetical protein SUGI_0842820 [Cryptomeria japonica]|nr:hypothetical protein SUGI_0842820 [Cryptomeria japonica]
MSRFNSQRGLTALKLQWPLQKADRYSLVFRKFFLWVIIFNGHGGKQQQELYVLEWLIGDMASKWSVKSSTSVYWIGFGVDLGNFRNYTNFIKEPTFFFIFASKRSVLCFKVGEFLSSTDYNMNAVVRLM